jgi:hypothetical protein
MAFKKAASQQAFIKASLYGPPGSGKTYTSLLVAEGLAKKMGKRVAYIDTEHGTDFYATDIPARKSHPKAFDFDAIYTRSLSEVLRELKALDTNVYGVFVLDSITHLWRSTMDAYVGKKTGVNQESIPMHAWGPIKKPYKEMMNLLMAMPVHVFICGRQKNVFENDDSDKMVKVGVAINAEGETAYEPHICARLETRPSTLDQTQSTVYMYCEKDRSSVLQGRTITNPNFATFAPVLDVLTASEQAPAEDEDQRISDDSEIGSTLEAAKAAKSAEVYAALSASLSHAATVADLGTFSVAVKKAKKTLTEEHMEALRLAFAARKEHISTQATGAI